jgi:hypothetical protein
MKHHNTIGYSRGKLYVIDPAKLLQLRVNFDCVYNLRFNTGHLIPLSWLVWLVDVFRELHHQLISALQTDWSLLPEAHWGRWRWRPSLLYGSIWSAGALPTDGNRQTWPNCTTRCSIRVWWVTYNFPFDTRTMWVSHTYISCFFVLINSDIYIC